MLVHDVYHEPCVVLPNGLGMARRLSVEHMRVVEGRGEERSWLWAVERPCGMTVAAQL